MRELFVVRFPSVMALCCSLRIFNDGFAVLNADRITEFSDGHAAPVKISEFSFRFSFIYNIEKPIRVFTSLPGIVVLLFHWSQPSDQDGWLHTISS